AGLHPQAAEPSRLGSAANAAASRGKPVRCAARCRPLPKKRSCSTAEAKLPSRTPLLTCPARVTADRALGCDDSRLIGQWYSGLLRRIGQANFPTSSLESSSRPSHPLRRHIVCTIEDSPYRNREPARPLLNFVRRRTHEYPIARACAFGTELGAFAPMLR